MIGVSPGMHGLGSEVAFNDWWCGEDPNQREKMQIAPVREVAWRHRWKKLACACFALDDLLSLREFFRTTACHSDSADMIRAT